MDVNKWTLLSQKTGFLAHFERFPNYTPLHPDKLHPNLLLKINILCYGKGGT